MRSAFSALGLLNEAENRYGIKLPKGLYASRMATIEMNARTGFINSQKKINATNPNKK